MMKEGHSLREKLWRNAVLFREKMTTAGFTLAGADHAIIPVMLGDAKLAQIFAKELLDEGIYVTGFSTLLYHKARHVFVLRCLQHIVRRIFYTLLKHSPALVEN